MEGMSISYMDERPYLTPVIWKVDNHTTTSEPMTRNLPDGVDIEPDATEWDTTTNLHIVCQCSRSSWKETFGCQYVMDRLKLKAVIESHSQITTISTCGQTPRLCVTLDAFVLMALALCHLH